MDKIGGKLHHVVGHGGEDEDVNDLFASSGSGREESARLSTKVTPSEWLQLSFDQQVVHGGLCAGPSLQLPSEGMFSTATQDHLHGIMLEMSDESWFIEGDNKMWARSR
eukprot:2317881-Amphidinium_carterae.1